jgi:DNA polymerase IV
VRPRQVDAFLLPLPVGRLPGVGKVMQGKLAELGIATIAQLRAMPQAELELRFGRWGRRLHELSLGIDHNPVRPERPTVQISSEDDLEPQIRRLAAGTWAGYQRERARHQGRLARTVVLKLKTSDFRILTRSLTPPVRPATLEALADIACELRARVELPAGTRYRLVGVGLSGFVDEDDVRAQSDLFEPA